MRNNRQVLRNFNTNSEWEISSAMKQKDYPLAMTLSWRSPYDVERMARPLLCCVVRKVRMGDANTMMEYVEREARTEERLPCERIDLFMLANAFVQGTKPSLVDDFLNIMVKLIPWDTE